MSLLWKLLKSINSSQMQDVTIFKEKAGQFFNMWIQVFRRTMSANLHALIVHGAEYMIATLFSWFHRHAKNF